MRSIDADSLESETCSGCVNNEHKYANCIDCALANAPTIDAIPVEWMMKVLADANEFPISERETIVAIPYLIKRWQKEQEAQDG